MLSPQARDAVGEVMRYGCYFCFFPFKWDPKTRRLLSKISKQHNLFFNFHGLVQCIMLTFSIARLLLGLHNESLPPRIRVMNGLWILAYIHGIQGFCELKYRKTQILAFANYIFEYIDKKIGTHIDAEEQYNYKSLLKNNLVSKCVLLSYFLLITSPGIHAVMLVGSPCASHFLSSLYFNCVTAGDDVGSLLEKLPFFILENYFVAVFFFLLAFNWLIVFLGLGWLRAELQEICENLASDQVSRSVFSWISKKYRHLQCGARLLNESFHLYLGWAPTIFMGHVSLLLFASFRYWDQDIISYLMFPLCGIRCMVDAVTPLAVAGYVYNESTKVLKFWERRARFGTDNISSYKTFISHLFRFKMSCPIISCTAGSFYKMKSAILPVNLNNLLQLTLNMLIALPHSPKQFKDYKITLN